MSILSRLLYTLNPRRRQPKRTGLMGTLTRILGNSRRRSPKRKRRW